MLTMKRKIIKIIWIIPILFVTSCIRYDEPEIPTVNHIEYEDHDFLIFYDNSGKIVSVVHDPDCCSIDFE